MIRKATRQDEAALRKIWETCFPEDTKEDIDLFFASRFDTADGFVYECEDKIASMMFCLPCKFKGKKAVYLYALATLPEYRSRQYMSRLINHLHGIMEKSKIEYSLLLESEEGLCDYYSRFGYKRAFCYNLAHIAGQNGNSVLFADADYVDKIRRKRLKNAVEWDAGAIEYAQKFSRMSDEKWFKVDDGYAIASLKQGKSYISELVCTDMIAAAQSVNAYFGTADAIVHLPPQAAVGERVYRGMIYSQKGEEITDAYLSMTLE